MKQTNLELVQNILSSMDSDNVNSISDTEEASQVETILKETYENIISRRRWAFLSKTRQLQNVIDLTRPNKYKIPEAVVRVEEFRYRTNKEGTNPQEYSWKTLHYLSPADFIDHVQSRNITQLAAEGTAITVENDDLVHMYIVTNKEPKYWTSFDDVFIYVDNYVAADGDTVMDFRSSVNVTEQQPFTRGDTEIQFLPPEMFALFLAEAKSTCWLNFKGAANQKAEQVASRQYIKMREEEPTVQPERTWVNYGKPSTKSRPSNSRRSLANRF